MTQTAKQNSVGKTYHQGPLSCGVVAIPANHQAGKIHRLVFVPPKGPAALSDGVDVLPADGDGRPEPRCVLPSSGDGHLQPCGRMGDAKGEGSDGGCAWGVQRSFLR